MTSDFSDIILSVFKKEALKRLVFSRPFEKEAAIKVSARLCSHRGKRILAIEYSLADNTVAQKNINEDELKKVIDPLLSMYKQVNLITTLGNAERKLSNDRKQTLLGADKLYRKLEGDVLNFEATIEALDKKKEYILDGKEPFLFSLGISDRSGRVHDKKQGKFRQICRFTEHISDIYEKLPQDNELLVYDLCCGKSYLGFAVYHYLTVIRKRQVNMLSVDLKSETVKRCEMIAKELGFNGMHFICDDIRNLPKNKNPDLVLSLHACDIATDIVLDSAMELKAKVILSTPCCHRYLNDKINAPQLSFVTDFPHLKNKLCEVLTDSIRLARLRAHGYKVSAIELTDPDDTPKNTLLRAIRVKTDETSINDAKAEYEKILSFVLGDNKNTYLNEIG